MTSGAGSGPPTAAPTDFLAEGGRAGIARAPAATIYATILREIQKKGDEARFRQAARGKFHLAKRFDRLTALSRGEGQHHATS